jgi:nucleoside-diphosphate-sugar epimerase
MGMTRLAAEDVVVTGGAGYIGAVLVRRLLAAGHRVRVVDSLLHGQDEVARELEELGASVIIGDVRDESVRADSLEGADAVVHLAAIVGDPACALDPETANEVNVEGSRSVVAASERAGVARFVFASTCSNYGRIADPTVPIDEDGVLSPVSLYAEQKVAVERSLLGRKSAPMAVTCLRFATVYGVAPRMRFDLTVNEFARDLWAGQTLQVFGEQFWRPYVHVNDAAQGIERVLNARVSAVSGRVFNVGRTSENYTKEHIVAEVRRQLGRGEVVYVHRDEDPRDYKVSFERIATTLGFEPQETVSLGIAELVAALEGARFGDPFDPRYRNTPPPS